MSKATRIPALNTATTPSVKRASNSDGRTQFNLSLDPETAREFHDETLPQEGAKTAHFPVSPACLPRHSFNVSGSRRLVAP
jgi:thiamine biosynthesis protein ThiC